MKIRLTGTADECAHVADQLADVLDVLEVSAFHPNRGTTVLGRLYLKVRADVPETLAAPAPRPARRTARQAGGERS